MRSVDENQSGNLSSFCEVLFATFLAMFLLSFAGQPANAESVSGHEPGQRAIHAIEEAVELPDKELPDSTIVASSEANATEEEFTVTVVTDGNGEAFANPDHGAPGTVVTLTAIPNEQYEFDYWSMGSEGGGASIDGDRLTIGNGDVVVSAHFYRTDAERVSVSYGTDQCGLLAFAAAQTGLL